MATPKIVLNASRDIPFNKLVLSQANVRKVKAGVSIEELAEDIARRTLLHSLAVRPVLDAEGAETGVFEVPVGGRRFRALELLVKQKRMSKTQPVPCVVRTTGFAEEDSLAENVQRAPLHPLDQFRAFQTLREAGLGEEEIAARFFVAPGVVKQRLKLAAAAPALLDAYAEDRMTLEQLMAFTVSGDHARQEQVWEALSRAYSREPYQIRRLLTEGAVRASDKRALFVGVEAYEAAGGTVMRDLFQHDDGGWLQDPALLDRLVAEKLEAEAATVRAEGWRWVEVALAFPYGHSRGLRRLAGEPVPLSEAEQATYDALHAEYEGLEGSEPAEAEELDRVARRLAEIDMELRALEERPLVYETAEVARAGVFVSVDVEGGLQVDRGYVRPEDEAPVEPVVPAGGEETSTAPATAPAGGGSWPVAARPAAIAGGASVSAPVPVAGAATSEEDEGLRPLPERLLIELSVHRTLALRDALANDPDTAFLAALHALCLRTFTQRPGASCLELELKSAGFGVQPSDLAASAAARSIDARQRAWSAQLPSEPAALWETLLGFDGDSRAALFAHCVSFGVNAVHEPWNRAPQRAAHADLLAGAVGLDMAAAGWTATVDSYLGRVPKARILEAVREARGPEAAQLIDHLRKPDMAKEAERLLAGSGWLPEPLRRPLEPAGSDADAAADAARDAEGDGASLPAFLTGDGEIPDAGDEADRTEAAAA
ncbi:ParB N-terminal domain-containing protein [Azospirillum sp. RWY-5-1]|uniref:ParB N-terminal domain-containing protein n=1 Tax=Azospirillum oleiclasticum TaxID=2735135 RepID=A0ABX2TFB5_9PROT|nr:ParB/Srx family N-terminal domain-containing protein [Azospirillum oleiclasticum]NYZ16891.1 ParB N-terminal domain-containing protein [Azospirillum oleiclasticum]NYZ21828.1 ParB N-terminal domain-containing protein [Azospirillum oleiclasticum]